MRIFFGHIKTANNDNAFSKVPLQGTQKAKTERHPDLKSWKFLCETFHSENFAEKERFFVTRN